MSTQKAKKVASVHFDYEPETPIESYVDELIEVKREMEADIIFGNFTSEKTPGLQVSLKISDSNVISRVSRG